ncbi:GntR family transcriptional regulator [Cytobacillus praedii]|uniref:GntR family transcriptional regulator n=1 Tax=Cytobacillus praedii TaxID=1742358 RepID=A0A4R1AX46_9BACI|nr:GntR family transcriptional regulator [Cytobacillus praedii]TCJ02495.1 GntR family transcriptional regulator [Cytobacillus praedii]
MGLKLRSSELICKKIISAILEGEYKINEPLLPERDMAVKFHVGRPTIREALQRLERDGWIAARKGMPAVVNDYWSHGNLMTIVDILQCYDEIPNVFIEYMLGLRIAITPIYMKEAVVYNRLKVLALFAKLDELQDDTKSYAAFDWALQQNLTQLSPNPIYRLLFNSFTEIYIPMAEKYFKEPHHRIVSNQYFNELVTSLLKGDVEEAERITKTMMEKSLILWKKKSEEVKAK